VPQQDLSVRYRIGKAIDDIDPATRMSVKTDASQDILQIYIPGFKENHKKWV
jgi:hypothetical protein